MEDRLQVFNREGQLLTYIGLGHGELPGQFKALVGVAIDKQNRVFTTEQYPGRLQMFRYVTDAEAAAEKKRQEDERKKPPISAATPLLAGRLPKPLPRKPRTRQPRRTLLLQSPLVLETRFRAMGSPNCMFCPRH